MTKVKNTVGMESFAFLLVVWIGWYSTLQLCGGEQCESARCSEAFDHRRNALEDACFASKTNKRASPPPHTWHALPLASSTPTTGMKQSSSATLFLVACLALLHNASSFMLPRASVLAFQRVGPSIARAPAHAVGRRMMLSRSLAMAANPKVRFVGRVGEGGKRWAWK